MGGEELDLGLLGLEPGKLIWGQLGKAWWPGRVTRPPFAEAWIRRPRALLDPVQCLRGVRRRGCGRCGARGAWRLEARAAVPRCMHSAVPVQTSTLPQAWTCSTCELVVLTPRTVGCHPALQVAWIKKAPPTVQKAMKPDLILVHYFDGWAEVHKDPSKCELSSSLMLCRAVAHVCQSRGCGLGEEAKEVTGQSGRAFQSWG
jgi:hypothetical protein